jgi:chromatin assembly factor 1 subunit A
MKSTSANQNALPSISKPVKPFFFTPASDLQKSSPLASIPTPQAPKDKDGKPKKLLPAEDLPAFKAAIVGSDLSKVGLIEVLKKRFPGRAAAAIKATLEVVARRGEKGEKEKDKRWVLNEP